jgi:hypothetical protein
VRDHTPDRHGRDGHDAADPHRFEPCWRIDNRHRHLLRQRRACQRSREQAAQGRIKRMARPTDQLQHAEPRLVTGYADRKQPNEDRQAHGRRHGAERTPVAPPNQVGGEDE